MKFLEHMMRKQGFESLILTGHFESWNVRRKQRITHLASLNKWMAEEDFGEIKKIGEKLLRVTKNSKLWRPLIANVLK